LIRNVELIRNVQYCKQGETEMKAKPEIVPTLEEALETLAGHVKLIATEVPYLNGQAHVRDRARGECGIGVPKGPKALLHFEIVADTNNEDPWGVWAQVTMRKGERKDLSGVAGEVFYQGNRAGACIALAKHYAPVIEWIAAYWAAKETTEGPNARAELGFLKSQRARESKG
jgi:hypothetical protein